MSEHSIRIAYVITFCAATMLLLSLYLSVCNDYPYYFMWDMNHHTTVDTILINSGLLPEHMLHPGFGMYLLLVLSEKITYGFDSLSALTLGDIESSLNPIVVVAELTDFIKFHSPILAVSICVFLCASIGLVFEDLKWYLIIFFVTLGMQDSFIYQSSMVRSELYSLFYWSIAVFILAVAVRAKKLRTKYLCLSAVGVFLGLCFLTKVQSLFYIAALPPIIFLMSSFCETREGNAAQLRTKGQKRILLIGAFNVISFTVLSILAYLTPLPDGMPDLASSFGITRLTILFFTVLALLFVIQAGLYYTGRAFSNTSILFSYINTVALGFVLSFGLHFLLYPDPAISWRYLLNNFKMTFLRRTDFFEVSNTTFLSYSKPVSAICYNPVIFGAVVILSLILILGYRRGIIRITKQQIKLCFLMLILAIGNMVLMTRFNLRDILWVETFFNFLIFIYISIILSRSIKHYPIFRWVSNILLAALLSVNLIHTYKMPGRINANYNQYGWRKDIFFSSPFRTGDMLKYAQVMNRRYYGLNPVVAEVPAMAHRRIKKIVSFVFTNQNISLRNVGVAFEGFSVWNQDLEWKITAIPPILRGAILVDNTSVVVRENTFLKPEYVRTGSEYRDKFDKSCPSRQLSVLSRLDLTILLFVPKDNVRSLLGDEIGQTPFEIILKNGEQTITLQGLEIKNYCRIPLDKIKDRFFFVICHN